jgi:hypothetical protein
MGKNKDEKEDKEQGQGQGHDKYMGNDQDKGKNNTRYDNTIQDNATQSQHHLCSLFCCLQPIAQRQKWQWLDSQ